VHWTDGESPTQGRGRSSRLGDDLPTLDTGSGMRRNLSSASGTSRIDASPRASDEQSRSRSLSPSPSPMARANSIFREISQRVVNLSNDTDMVEQSIKRKTTIRRGRRGTTAGQSEELEEELPSDVEAAERPQTPVEKRPSVSVAHPLETSPVYQTPLRGRSWGIFGPGNLLRKSLCELLVHPMTEPTILVLIVAQTVLLAVNAASDAIYHETRSRAWGVTGFDYAIFGLFVVYTLELAARTIVSGFISNPYEYSTLDRSMGLKQAILKKSNTLFAPPAIEGQAAAKNTEPTFQPSIVRTFTDIPNVDPDMPGHGKYQQRMRLTRRAFLRHSFNRLDFVAVVAYWISFGMQISRYEMTNHVYVFNMLSCLRILRLLGLTAGTSVILRSLKKAAPLLVHVAFLIGFFWLIFGIVGVQSFKSSLRRTCVWVGDDGSGQNYTLNLAPENVQFCGGYLDAVTGQAMPWLKGDGSNGTSKHKGYLCPQGSLCVEDFDGPYNGTVTFDNIFQSLELVFVIVSSNTFSTLMYYLMDTDYMIAALFFATGIVVLSLWLMNLLVAVITSSFQIIREESKRSAFQVKAPEEPAAEEETKSRVSGLKRLYDKTHVFWVVLIAFDLIVQSLRSASMGPTRHAFIMNSETVVTLLLLVEIILRFVCDWRGFIYSKRNWADLILAVVTTITQIPPIRNSGQPYAWLTAFQIARIYRVVLAVRVTRELIMIVFKNIAGVLNLIVFVFLFTFLAAIMASQLFRGDFPATDPSGTENHVQFYDIWNSFIGMYQILSSENWTIIMFNATQSNLMWDTAWLGAAFCILWFIIANFIILNMFIAVIQESFDVSEDEKRLQQVKAFLRQKEMSGSSAGNLSLSSIFKLGRESMKHRDALEYGSAAMEQLLKDAVVKDFLDENDDNLNRRPTTVHLSDFPATVKPGFLSKIWGKIAGLNSHHDPNPFYSNNTVARAQEDFDPRAVAKQVVSAAENRRRVQRQYLTRHPRYNVSLFIFGPRNLVRRLCQHIVGPGRGEERIEGVSPYKPVWYAFSAFTYAAIVAMVVLACVTTPLYQREYYQMNQLSITNWFVWTDLGFAILFSVEALIRVIADGFLMAPHAYYRTVWGFIDAVVLVTLWINIFTAIFRDDGVSRAVGAFKALRALRLLNISDSARDTFHSVIIIGIYKIVAAAFVSLSLLVPFAIFGLNLFNGKMEACNDGGFGFSSLSNCVGEYNSTPYNWPVLAPRQVSNPYYDFDDFGSSLFILFQIVSQEGWTDVMWSGMSITGRGTQPQSFASVGNAVYFIIFNLLGAVFVLTLFISVFMRNYTEQTGVAFLTAEQRSWLELRKLLKQISPSKRSLGEKSSRLRRWCYDLSIKKRGRWQRFITALLLVHMALLIIEFYPEPAWWEKLREYMFLVFTLILTANVLIRITGLSWERFRRSTWDVYSLASVSGSLVTSVLSAILEGNRQVDQLQKLFLVSLLFLLIPRNNQLDQLFKTAAVSLPMIANLLATWFVLFLVFAIALTQALGLTRFGANESGNANFRNVPKALIFLFTTSIGEGWNAIMEDFATITPPFCVQEDSFFESDCGSKNWARALFVAWNIISMYIFVSLFVSLIFESFSYVYQRSSGLSVVTRDEIRRFKHAWAEFDPNGTGYISKEAFPRLLGVSNRARL
jgi:voltage-dependent calcium channel